MNKKINRMISVVLCIIFLSASILNFTVSYAADEQELLDGKFIIYENCTDLSQYRGTAKTAPEKSGYVFAGWYEKNGSAYQPLNEKETDEKSTAYAKYVDENVLQVKGQLKADTTEVSTSTDLRMVTTVDSLNYGYVGFNVTIKGKTVECHTDTVYRTINAYVDNQGVVYNPDTFSKASGYFMTHRITGIPNREFATTITIEPVWKTLDGTVVKGIKREISIYKHLEDNGNRLKTYDYSLSKGTIDFSLIEDLSASDITALEHTDGTTINYSVSGETLTISNDAVLNADGKTATGAVTTIVIKTVDVTYRLPLRVVTLAIRTTDDFYSLPGYLENKKVEGYFVLCNDLDFAGKEEFITYCGYNQVGSGGSVGWNAVFDGQNHVIHNLALSKAWNNGIFGTIGFGGVVRNVAFTGAENKGYGGCVCDDIYGTVENIYVEGIASQTAYSAIGGNTGCLFANNIEYAGATIQNITVVATGSWTDKNRALAAGGIAVDDNVVVIGAAENRILGSYTSIADIQEANAKINAYVTAGEAAKAKLPANGSASFKLENGNFCIYFGETCVYQEEVKLELATYDYSLGKGTVDFSLIEGLRATDITSMEHADGTAINYSVSGETVAINGDTVLNADGRTATGAVTTVVVKTADIMYTLPLRVVTLAIRTTDDFYTLPNYLENKKVEGYFVLCNDLDFAGKEEFITYCGYNQVGSGGSVGWNAVFDGQNHVIHNLALSKAWNNGIFGTIGFGGVVRNVAFTGAENKGYGGCVCDDIYGTVENIYVEGIASQTAYSAIGGNTGCLFANNIEYAGATIQNITVVATGSWTDKNRALAAGGIAVDDNVVVIGAAENRILGSYTSIADIQAENAKIKAFVTAKAAAEASLPANGSADFTSEEGALKISWNGIEVYSESID